MEKTCAPSTGDCIENDCHFPSGNGKMALAEAFLRTGKCAAVINSVFDADVEAASYCVHNKCFGVITGDSDFFPLQVPNVLSVSQHSLTQSAPSRSTFTRQQRSARSSPSSRATFLCKEKEKSSLWLHLLVLRLCVYVCVCAEHLRYAGTIALTARASAAST